MEWVETNHMGRLIKETDALGQYEAYEYDNNGNLTKKIDRNGVNIVNTYDNLNRLTETKAVTIKGEAKEYIKSTYSANGLLLKTENENLTTTNTYDNLGRIAEQSDSNGTKRTYTYDTVGNRTSFKLYIDAVVRLNQTYEYDRLNRLTTVYKDSQAEAAYSYDANGNRASMTLGNGIITSYAYNKANLVTSLSNKQGTQEVSSFAYSYYLDGNQAAKAENTGKVTEYGYDDIRRLTTETESSSGNITTRTYTYDNASNRSEMSVTKDGETEKTTYTYDLNNRLVREVSNNTTTGDQKLSSYTYDANGNQLMRIGGTINLSANGFTPALGVFLFRSDESEGEGYAHLAEELEGATKTATGAEQKLGISRLGNEADSTSEYDSGYAHLAEELEGITKTATGAEQKLGISMLGNGADSMPKYDSEVNTYDVFNRLVKVEKSGTKAEYKYKADGLRLSKTVNGETTEHIWDGSNIVAEADSGGVIIDVYVRGINLISSDVNGYYLYNAHGDVVELSDGNGSITKSYTYDAFGVEEDVDDIDVNPFRYCGEYYDTETGSIYLRARYYKPKTGSFLSEDPIRDGLNWYTYANNNPIMYVAPSGLLTYILYGLPHGDEGGFEEQAKYFYSNLSQIDDDVRMYAIETESQFKEIWDSMPDDQKIDRMYMLFHSNPHNILLDYTKEEYVTSYASGKTRNTPDSAHALSIHSLGQKNIGFMELLSCNTGHLDHTDDNVAMAFLTTQRIDSIGAFDGSMSYTKIGSTYSPRLSLQSRYF